MTETTETKSGRASGASEPGVIRHLAVAAGVAALMATVFTAWTPASLSPGELAERLAAALEGQGASESAPAAVPAAGALPGGLRIGIVAGHSGLHPETGLADPGAVCPDGLTELQVNTSIAELAVEGLRLAGLEPDLLQEWDPRLTGYSAVALVSIHTDSCVAINPEAAGYKIAAAVDTAVPDRSQRLVTCLADRYASATGLPFHPGSITRDMTEYHTFYEIHSSTPAAIIEVGFLYLDRGFLTQSPEKAASGIVEGILCYLHNQPASLPAEPSP
jgi:N-acetylmuramoyl-L-alanine amidase